MVLSAVQDGSTRLDESGLDALLLLFIPSLLLFLSIPLLLMSFYVRFAQKGEEAPLARIHVSAFSIPDEAFVFPHYRDFTSYNLAMAQAKYAKFIQKGSVACAVEAESGRLVGLHCWILPGVPHESGHSNQRYELGKLSSNSVFGLAAYPANSIKCRT